MSDTQQSIQTGISSLLLILFSDGARCGAIISGSDKYYGRCGCDMLPGKSERYAI